MRRSGPEELVGLINALTTNVTAFYREKHHFEALAEYMLPEAMDAQRRFAPHSHLVGRLLDRRGAYCVAMTAADVLPPGAAGTSRFSRPTSTAT